MASTVLKDRIANWPEGQVEKGIQKPTLQLDIGTFVSWNESSNAITLSPSDPS
jgi:hypothetical protein